MADATEVYYPQQISDNPIPTNDSILIPAQNIGTSPTGKTVNTTSSVHNNPIPQRVVAHETISNVFDTVTKKIKGVFEFTKLGALKIGEYVNGVSGEIDITPNGITAKNVNGDTTFSLDGTTGDGTFLGTLQAGTLLGGDNKAVIDDDGSGNGRIVLYDSSNNPVILLSA